MKSNNNENVVFIFKKGSLLPASVFSNNLRIRNIDSKHEIDKTLRTKQRIVS